MEDELRDEIRIASCCSPVLNYPQDQLRDSVVLLDVAFSDSCIIMGAYYLNIM